MTTRMILPGHQVQDKPKMEAQLQDELDGFLDVNIVVASEVDVRQRGTASEEAVVLDNAEDDDIVEIEFDNGARQWVSVAQLREDLEQTGLKRGASRELALPSMLRQEGATRGLLTDLGVKALKLIRTKLPDEIESKIADEIKDMTVGLAADKAALRIAGYFEDKLNPGGPGLYRFTDPQLLGEKVGRKDLDNKAPWLLFLHGTASTSTGSFSRLGAMHSFDKLGLENSPEWNSLKTFYNDRILGFEHRTFTESPFLNALQAAENLPDGTRLHLVSHSRGGLVGELLCLGMVDALGDPARAKDLLDLLSKPFEKGGRKEEIKQLAALIEALVGKRIQVEKFVRVACPARGTTLLSGRLDLYLSSILNVIGLIPWLKASPTYKFVKAILLELAKRRTDPEVLPGIEAMLPTSPLVYMLNALDLQTSAGLAVISGDIEGGDLLDRLKIFMTDVYYREDHDLVVNTAAMSGGMKRDRNAFIYFDKGAEVSHFSYFKNHNTRSRLAGWLTSADAGAGTAERLGFAEIKPAKDYQAPVRADRAAQTQDLPVVFVLPGIMGTHLKVGDDRIWLDPVSLALGRMGKLKYGARVTPEALVPSAYERLIDFLGFRYQVIPFPYDWRLSVRDSAALLADEVSRQLKSHRRSIRFVAHSMGGLVMRAMIALHGDVWKELCSRDARVVLLGTPSEGSFVIPQLLAGREKMLKMLALLDLRNDSKDLIRIIRDYPGILEMLPEEMLESGYWNGLKDIERPTDASLTAARNLRKDMRGAIDRERMIYVAGTAPSTPSGLKMENGKLVFAGTTEGDGRVTYRMGLIEGVATWYSDAQHGDLADHSPSFPALVDLLDQGKTERLSRAPRVRRGVPTEHALIDEVPQEFPDNDDLIAAALGQSRKRIRIEEPHTIQISIANGHLREARFPIAVGHYKGDVITGAERVIDNQLDNQLSQLFQMGIYPGEDGTLEILRNHKPGLPGAMVIGFGEMGEITPEKVRSGVTAAALRNALRVLNDARSNTSDGWVSAGFSSLLLGSYSSGQVTVQSSVSAIIQGALLANKSLQAQGLWDKVRIDAVEIIELYEDIATEAINSVARLVERPPVELAANELIELVPPYLRMLSGRLPQRPADQYSSGWWRRVKVSVADTDAGVDVSERKLRFTILTDRARAEEEEQVSQRRLVDSFISNAITKPFYDEKLSSTLFELMVPNVYKDQLVSQGNILLVVDSEAANYPWELMAARGRSGVRPLACDRGIIRQLVTGQYRQNPQSAKGRNALIVGDPILNDKRFVQLDGARAEAEMAAGTLGSSFDVTALINSGPLPIISTIFERDYRIIHLAGHGHYDPDHPVNSGMVLGDGMWLSSAEFRQMRVVPDLVFINCCHLGKVDTPTPPQESKDNKVESSNKLAASISQELISMGVKAVVAAGWAVDDAAALTFAETFYDNLLRNETFGDSILAARKRTWELHRTSNTWGAYQCYGNPDFRLNNLGGGVTRYTEEPLPRSKREYRNQIRKIIRQSGFSDSEAMGLLRNQLGDVERSLPPIWADGELLSLFGEAWISLGDFEKGIDAYRRAVRDNEGGITLYNLQQFANMLAKYGRILAKKAKSGSAREKAKTEALSIELLQEAEALLDALRAITSTPELLSISASLYKNWARIDEKNRLGLIRQAEDFYHQAYELSATTGGQLDPYPGLNWLTCRYIADYLSPGKRKSAKAARQDKLMKAEIESIRELAAGTARSDYIWHRIYHPDAELFYHLIGETLTPRTARALIEKYNFALKERASREDLDTVRGQFNFIIEMLSSTGERFSDIRGLLENIRDSLNK